MELLNVYGTRLMLYGVVTVIVFSVVNARGEFRDDFDRPDGGIGNGWGIDNRGNLDIKIVDNEILIAGQQRGDWNRSGIYRPVEGETGFSFDFKADNFAVHIELDDAETLDTYSTRVEVFASPGGPFYYTAPHEGSIGWSQTEIPGSYMIPGEYNTLVVEQNGTKFTLILNGQVVGAFTNDYFTRVGEVFISADAADGTVGSLHIDNVVIDQVPIITNFDFNGDGTVDVNDVVTLTDHWGQDYSVCDISPMPLGDGIVDAKDLLALANYLEQETALIAHWAFDETEGMFAADSVGDNDAIVLGGIEWQPAGGQIDGALQLDGVSGYAIAGAVLNPAEGPFSIFAWVNGGTPGQVIVSQQFASNWLATDAEGNLITELQSSDPLAEPLISETIITDKQWHRIGLVWDGSNRTLYVDGVVVAEDTQYDLESSEMGLNIGAGKMTQPGTYFSGLIDDVRIYNRAVSP